MNDEIQLISDGDGLAVIGREAEIEGFLASMALPARPKGVEGRRLDALLRTGSAVAQAAGTVAADSHRWVKLTAESAHKVKKYGLTPTKTPGISHAMIGKVGASRSWLQIEQGLGTFATNPAILAGAGGIMAQLAMQQTIDEITDYLAVIDAKVDDVLRAQKDAVLAQAIGTGYIIEDALTVRAEVGAVSDTTWSKVQGAPTAIAQTQAYALRQLDWIAEKIERNTKIGDLAKASKEAEAEVRDWLAVLARSFQLMNALDVLELDRVLDASPQELDRHRLGLRAARQNRLAAISHGTERLITLADSVGGRANTKVLLHPSASPALVQSSNQVGLAVVDLHGRLGIARGRESLDARRWSRAAAEARDKALETGAVGVRAAKRLGTETLGRAKSARGRLVSDVADRVHRRPGPDDPDGNADGSA
ncbi:hypothetical protein OG216_35345 [Streptomycetaceae bacterium NBC_01309]